MVSNVKLNSQCKCSQFNYVKHHPRHSPISSQTRGPHSLDLFTYHFTNLNSKRMKPAECITYSHASSLVFEFHTQLPVASPNSANEVHLLNRLTFDILPIVISIIKRGIFDISIIFFIITHSRLFFISWIL